MTSEEYLPARLELLKKEKENTRARDALARERRALPVTKVEKHYVFTDLDDRGNKVEKSLKDLFDGRQQLIIYHFMFDPTWEAGCPSCSIQAAAISSIVPHLNSRGTTLVGVSRAPIEKIQAYKKRLGLTVPWVSSLDNTFNKDFHVTLYPGDDDAQYNFMTRDTLLEKNMSWFTRGEQPGQSSFILGDAEKGLGETGVVYHTYSSYSRGLEFMNPTFGYLDTTKLGRRDEIIGLQGLRFRRHDEYSKAELRGIWE